MAGLVALLIGGCAPKRERDATPATPPPRASAWQAEPASQQSSSSVLEALQQDYTACLRNNPPAGTSGQQLTVDAEGLTRCYQRSLTRQPKEGSVRVSLLLHPEGCAEVRSIEWISADPLNPSLPDDELLRCVGQVLVNAKVNVDAPVPIWKEYRFELPR